MNNSNDSTDDEEQLKPLATDYHTLLATTRPFVITQPICRSLGFPIDGDEAISLKAGDWWVEFALKKGEIICGDVPIAGIQSEDGPMTTSALPKRGSNLRIRIHLGMS
jgi:hypothetical protein